MKTLILMRHAKSDWADAELADFDRPLNARGRKAAALMGAWLAERGYRPDIVLHSPAARAVETLGQMKPHLPRQAKIQPRRALYLATPQEILGEILGQPAHVKTALVIGHNPGLADCARWLAGEGAKKDLARLHEKFPTGAIAILAFPIAEWSAIEEKGGRLDGLMAPRDRDTAA